jgi:hypothetical protein
MTMARRGIFGMLAALPFVPKAATAALPQASQVGAALGFTAPDLNGIQGELLELRRWEPPPSQASQRSMIEQIFEQYIGRPVREPPMASHAPWGWDTLENVR